MRFPHRETWIEFNSLRKWGAFRKQVLAGSYIAWRAYRRLCRVFADSSRFIRQTAVARVVSAPLDGRRERSRLLKGGQRTGLGTILGGALFVTSRRRRESNIRWEF